MLSLIFLSATTEKPKILSRDEISSEADSQASDVDPTIESATSLLDSLSLNIDQINLWIDVLMDRKDKDSHFAVMHANLTRDRDRFNAAYTALKTEVNKISLQENTGEKEKQLKIIIERAKQTFEETEKVLNEANNITNERFGGAPVSKSYLND